MRTKLHPCLYFLLTISILSFSFSLPVKAQEAKRSQGRPVAASSVENSSFAATNAVDGNTSTKWSSLGDNYNQWFDVDLGTPYDISQVIIRWADGRYATHLDIKVRNSTSEEWVTIRTISENTASTANFIKGLKANARFVRFNGRGRANPVGYRISEFEVYGHPVTTSEQKKDIDTLTARLKKFHVARVIAGPDQVPDDSISLFMTKIGVYGGMSDINYGHDGNWRRHAGRLKLMAVAYHNPASAHQNSEALRKKIMTGLHYYFINSPYTHSNWWYVKIGGPESYMTAIILMKGTGNAQTADSLRTYSTAILDHTDEAGHKGKNRTWVSAAPIHRGCIEDRFYWVNKGYASMVTSLDLVTEPNGEGIKADNSFHQHNAQIQTGSYGRMMLEDHPDYMVLALGTQFINHYTTGKRQAVTNLMLRGLQLLSYKNQVDFGVVGRALAGHNGTINIPVIALDRMKLAQPDSAAAYENWKTHITGSGVYPAAYRGATHFWKSDIVSYRGADYYLSAKVISTRTFGTEMLNGENLKGSNLPMGATNIMSTGDEYRNIFPVWNWSRVPGTTAELNDAATLPDSSYVKGKNVFAGGMSHGDDGILTYDHNYRGVTAKKTYFFIGDMMLCLGTGITASKSNPVVTSVNQTTLAGDITYNRGASDEIFTGTTLTVNDFKWIHHNNVGYIFPEDGNVTLQKAAQSGSWRDLKTSGSTATQTRDIFSAWFDHTSTPSNGKYSYIVAPGRSVSEMPALHSSHEFVIVQNTASIQAIRNDTGAWGKWAVVFHNPGTVDMGNGMTITSDKKVIVLIKEYSGNYRISVSDPLYNQSSVTLKINKQVAGGTYASGFTTLNINFSTGNETGKVKTGFYNKISGGRTAAESQSLSPENQPLAEANIVIYPNPADEVIHVDGIADGATLEVYDITGRRVITTTKRQVNIGHLSSGAYAIRIFSNGAVTSRIFIKK